MVALAISSPSKYTDQVSTAQGTVVMKNPLSACVSGWGGGVVVLAIALLSKYTVSATHGTVVMKNRLGVCISEWGGGVVVLAILSPSKCTDQVFTKQGTVLMKNPLDVCISECGGEVALAISSLSKYTVSTTQGTDQW